MTRSVDTAPVVPRSGARNIGTSATGAGVLDKVADAHDVAGDGDVGAQRRPRRLRQRRRRHSDGRTANVSSEEHCE